MKLKTTAEFIDELAQKHNLKNDSAVAEMLGLTRSAISLQRSLKTSFDDATALKVAELLGYEPAYVLACARAQGARLPAVKSAWKKIAIGSAANIAAVAFAILILLGWATDLKSVGGQPPCRFDSGLGHQD